ncbi:MAG: hypothetical protein AB1724_12920 [Thermodesulfobacteriota bacterium]
MTGPNEECTQEQGHDIACLESLESHSAQALRSYWITSVEQFVASAATDQGRRGLNKLLAGNPASLDELLQESQKILGSQRYEALIQARPGGPLGARFDETQFNTDSDNGNGGAA